MPQFTLAEAALHGVCLSFTLLSVLPDTEKSATWVVPGCLCPIATYQQGLFNGKRSEVRERIDSGVKGSRAVDSQVGCFPVFNI